MSIPYNIECIGCADNQLVNEGTLVLPSTTIAQGSGPVTQIEFDLIFSYDIDGLNMESGDYADEVTIILEAGI